MQFDVLSKQDIKIESEAADISLRQSLKDDDRAVIPGVGVIARPNGNVENNTTKHLGIQTNVVDEVSISPLSSSLSSSSFPFHLLIKSRLQSVMH